MEVIEKTFEYTRSDKFFLYDLSDLHVGAVHCDEDLLAEKVYEIRQLGRRAIVLGGGDYGDCITPNELKRKTQLNIMSRFYARQMVDRRNIT